MPSAPSGIGTSTSLTDDDAPSSIGGSLPALPVPQEHAPDTTRWFVSEPSTEMGVFMHPHHGPSIRVHREKQFDTKFGMLWFTCMSCNTGKSGKEYSMIIEKISVVRMTFIREVWTGDH